VSNKGGITSKRPKNETHHLLGDHHDSLDAELPSAHVEHVFETRTEEINDEDVVQAFLAKVVDLRNAGWKRGRMGFSAQKSDIITSEGNHVRLPLRIL
jgi:hypothetical protein